MTHLFRRFLSFGCGAAFRCSPFAVFLGGGKIGGTIEGKVVGLKKYIINLGIFFFDHQIVLVLLSLSRAGVSFFFQLSLNQPPDSCELECFSSLPLWTRVFAVGFYAFLREHVWLLHHNYQIHCHSPDYLGVFAEIIKERSFMNSSISLTALSMSSR